jgi:hypothetical protein
MSTTVDQKDVYNTLTINLKKLTSYNCDLEIHVQEMKAILEVLTDRQLKTVEIELKTFLCKLKVSKDEQALTIYMLNGNLISYTKRLKQFKRHMAEYLECFWDLEIFNVDDYPEYRDVCSCWSFTHRIKETGSEEYYRQFCKEQQVFYNFFCDEKAIKFMSTVSWKNRHFLV